MYNKETKHKKTIDCVTGVNDQNNLNHFFPYFLTLLILRFLLFLPIPITGKFDVSIIIIIGWLLSSRTPHPRPPTQFCASSTYSPPITNVSLVGWVGPRAG